MMRVPLAGALALGRALALAPARSSSLRAPARAFASRMPEAGEVRLRVVANALCHTDIYTLEGSDPEGLFPSILGHEAGAIVESVGEGVTSVKVGDKVIPCYTPQCREADCIFCASPKTNLCPKIRGTQGRGVMPDGTTRFKTADGAPVAHFMGCSTFAEYTVVSEISCAKIDDSADLAKVCMLGCGVATGWGAAGPRSAPLYTPPPEKHRVHHFRPRLPKTANMEADASVAVFGCGAVGLAVIQAAKIRGARRIFAVDTNPDKFDIATEFGATDCVNPLELDGPVAAHLVGLTQWGVDYTFDCTGNTEVMRAALECAHRGWGVSVVIGVAAAGHEIATRPFQLVTGRTWKGTAFGGFKSRDEVPELVDRVLAGDLPIDAYITHNFDGVDNTHAAIDALHGGDCLRAVVSY
ncbi:alcohol dehydrogenase [Aureococcus anophagefferens]|nr:alcohol dehydrogenase [Aureococcus anophagefferens]